MALGLEITIDETTRTEKCQEDICFMEIIKLLGEKDTAAGMLGVDEKDIVEAKITGNCRGCKFYPYIRSVES
jgi:hypothetical protein